MPSVLCHLPVNKRQPLGFTLIELLVAIAIIGILVTVALPAYQDFVRKGRRADARNALMAVQMAQEKYRGNHLAYATAMSSLPVNATSEGGYYTLTVKSGSATASTYVIEATPGGTQAADSCGTFAVNHNGADNSSGYASADCWR